jgi:hypothetical protein
VVFSISSEKFSVVNPGSSALSYKTAGEQDEPEQRWIEEALLQGPVLDHKGKIIQRFIEAYNIRRIHKNGKNR